MRIVEAVLVDHCDILRDEVPLGKIELQSMTVQKAKNAAARDANNEHHFRN